MAAHVANVKVAHIRPKHHDLREWCADPQNVYVGRRGVVFVACEGKQIRYPQTDSPFANPFKVGKDGTREDVIEKYRKYIEARLEKEPDLARALTELKGKTLGCWCAPLACHADVLCDILTDRQSVSQTNRQTDSLSDDDPLWAELELSD